MELLPQANDGKVIQMLNPTTTATVALTVASAQSAAFTTRQLVEVYCDVDCFIAEGVNPVATVNSLIIIGGMPRMLIIEAGNKIAGILASGATNLRITY